MLPGARMFGHVAGFTFVEVLISLALVGVLASIAIAKYNDYRDRTNQSKAIMDIKIL